MRSSSWRSSAAVGWRLSTGTCGGSGLTRTIGGVLARARRASAWSVRPAAMSASAWRVHRPSQRSGSRRAFSMERDEAVGAFDQGTEAGGHVGSRCGCCRDVLAAGRWPVGDFPHTDFVRHRPPPGDRAVTVQRRSDKSSQAPVLLPTLLRAYLANPQRDPRPERRGVR